MVAAVAGEGPLAVLERLVAAVNAHDLPALVSCFAEDYHNVTPAHPQRGLRGRGQVRANWSQILAGVPDIHARVPCSAVDGDTLWTEWELAGTRTDRGAFLMRGVVIFRVADATIASARFYLEPVEEDSGDVNAQTQRVVGDLSRPAGPQAQS